MTTLLYVLSKGSGGDIAIKEEHYPAAPAELQAILDGTDPDIAKILGGD